MKKITLLFILCLAFNMQMFAQPSNDDPSGATPLTVGMVFADNPVVGTNVGATASEVADPSIPAPGCSTYSGGDVWYSLIVGASGEVTVETDADSGSTLTDTAFAIYSGPIGAFVVEACDDDDGNGLFSKHTLTGRTPGETLYVRVFEYQNNLFDTFQISAYYAPPPPPPANDECIDAIGLTINSDLSCGTVTAGTTLGATASAEDATGVSGTPNTDVWYSFTATNSSHTVALLNVVNQGGGTSTSTDMGMAVYDATGGCASLLFVDTSDPNTLDLTGLSVSTVYYVRVYGWATGIQYNNFDICVGTPPPPPANDDCANAIAIMESTDYNCNNVISGTTQGATNSTDYAVCSTTYEDVWYAFTPSTTGNYAINRTLTSGTATTYLNIWSGSCGALSQVNTSCTTTSLNVALTAGTPYYISVASFTPSVNFDLCVYPPSTTVPSNDECSTATGFSTLPFNESLDASAATNNAGFIDVGCSGNGMNDGVWYTFTTVDAGTVDIAITNVIGWDPEVAIYDGSCGALTCLSRADSSGTGFDETISGFAVNAATQYWVNVGYWSDSTDNPEGPFTITISTNDTTTLSLDDVEFNGFKYYPNPVNESLSLRAQDNIQNVIIYNMLGQEVVKAAPNALIKEVDMSDLQSGAYFVKVTINDATETIRIIKQ